MSRRFADDEEWPEDDLSDDDLSDDFGDTVDGDEVDEADEEEPTVPCPYCRRQIHEESLRCPYCEQYISTVDAPRVPKPWWLVIGVAACLYVMLRWLW